MVSKKRCASQFLTEQDDIFFASKIEIEGDDATRHSDGSEANHINAAVVEPNPYAAHEVAERIAASAFNACAKPCGSIHVALLIAGSGGSARILSVDHLPHSRARTMRLAYRLAHGLVKDFVRNRTIWALSPGHRSSGHNTPEDALIFEHPLRQKSPAGSKGRTRWGPPTRILGPLNWPKSLTPPSGKHSSREINPRQDECYPPYASRRSYSFVTMR